MATQEAAAATNALSCASTHTEAAAGGDSAVGSLTWRRPALERRVQCAIAQHCAPVVLLAS